MTTIREILRKQKASVRQERSIATKLGGRRVAGSGSQPGFKGDVKTSSTLVEAKQTVSKSYSLKLGTWRKIFAEATKAGRTPMMVIELAGIKLVVLDFNDYLALKE